MDLELALDEIVKSHDFSEMNLSYRKAFIDGWCDGFLEGYLRGCIETTIKVICTMKQEGIPSTQIEKCTYVSSEVINMMGN